jgi:hypothetical protein
MNANDRVKPPQEQKDVPSMMQEMMGKMCCSGKFSPVDMCRRMMRSMGTTPNAEASSAPATGTTPDEPRTSSEGEAHGGRCDTRSCCVPLRL